MAKPEVDHSGISGPKGNGESDTLKTLQAVLEPPPSSTVNDLGDVFSDVIRGKVFEPPKIMVYGIDGVGKSSFCAQAPNPIFLQAGLDKGLEQIGPARLPVCETYEDFISKLLRVATAKHDFNTVAVDNLSAIEALIYRKVCLANNWPTITYPGFDRGEKLATKEWLEIIDLLNRCHSRGMAVLLVAHARREKLGDPENPSLEQYAPALHAKTSGELFRKWVDATLFLTRRMTTRSEGQGLGEKKIGVAVGADGGDRVIRTTWTPGAVAKNRYGIPSEVPFPKEGAWNTVMGYIANFYEQKKG